MKFSLACGLAGSLLSTSVSAHSADDEFAPDFQALVTCRSVDVEEKRIEGRSGRQKLELIASERTEWFQHEVIPLSEIPIGSVLHVLSRRQKATASGTDAGSPSTEEMLIMVRAIVVGEFTPPRLTTEQKNQTLKWEHGPLKRPQAAQFTVGGTILQAGVTRKVLRLVPTKLSNVVKGKQAPLRKGAALRIEGQKVAHEVVDPEKGEPKKKASLKPLEVEVSRVEILAKGFPKEEYAIILGTAK